MNPTSVDLRGVPETTLWTLHNRASEARRSDGVSDDPRCLEIYRAIDYDYERSFGKADSSHGVRSWVFDNAVRDFIARHPDGVIANLGEGLETQRFRIRDDDDVLWLSIDLPEAIAVRERFIAPDERHLHIARSALDPSWLDAVPEGRPLFVTAQGLFMYFQPAQVGEIIAAIASRVPGAELMFDHIPPWFSAMTTSPIGLRLTRHYTAPPMPWGVRISDVLPRLRAWAGEVEDIGRPDFNFPRGLRRVAVGMMLKIPWLNNHVPGVTRVRLVGGKRDL